MSLCSPLLNIVLLSSLHFSSFLLLLPLTLLSTVLSLPRGDRQGMQWLGIYRLCTHRSGKAGPTGVFFPFTRSVPLLKVAEPIPILLNQAWPSPPSTYILPFINMTYNLITFKATSVADKLDMAGRGWGEVEDVLWADTVGAYQPSPSGEQYPSHCDIDDTWTGYSSVVWNVPLPAERIWVSIAKASSLPVNKGIWNYFEITLENKITS